jgi:hypothetical protein
MKPVLLNFSSQKARKQWRRDWSVLALSLLLLIFVIREAQTLQDKQLQRLQNQAASQQAQQALILSGSDPQQEKLARSMAESLNLPWYELLAALESIKTMHPEVYLTSVLPDARKQQLVISGQVARLDLLLSYIDALNQHALFSDTLPVSQQQAVTAGRGMTFTLKTVWQHE